MNGSRHEAITHVLALIAVAVILILAAAFVASSASAPSRKSQTAAACETINGQVYCGLGTGASLANTPGAPDNNAVISDNPEKEIISCPRGPIEVNYACSQEGKVGDTKTLLQNCRPGFEYTVNEVDKGILTVSIEPLLGGPSLEGCSVPPPRQCETGNAQAKWSANPQACRVIYCLGVNVAGGAKAGCFAAQGSKDEKLSEVAAKVRGNALGNLLAKLDTQEVDPAMTQLGISLEDSVVKAAFDNAETSIQQQIQKNDDAIRSIKEYAEGCGLVSCDAKEFSDTKAELTRLEQQNKDLSERIAGLAKTEVRLAPTPPERPTPPPETPPIVPPPPGPTTFPDLGGGPLGGAGGLGQLLQGLMKGLGGQQGQGSAPPPGNQNPQTPGTCTPQLVCTNNTLFSRNSQCVDVPMQQCPHGCTGNTCNQPPGAPTAQLSCQPQIADPGMTIAITWGCSAGISTASGFSTGGALSGATSTVVTAPPEGTNTVAFGLICTNQTLSSSASCTVQVTKPAIVLVANPDTVALNETSTIGWVTSGMEKCTVSSPDQLDFTERNASRTNINGVAETSPITETTDVFLTCTTLGGNIREATTTISVLGGGSE